MSSRSSRRFSRRPASAPWTLRLVWATGVLLSLLFIWIAVVSIRRHDALTGWRRELEATAGRPAWPAWTRGWPPLPPTPPPQRRSLEDLSGPYAFVAGNPQLLRHIPCYCGCARQGHRSSLDCFVKEFAGDGTPVWSDHSTHCPMCLHIARETFLMSSQGMSAAQIRAAIEERYQTTGQATPTPRPEGARP